MSDVLYFIILLLFEFVGPFILLGLVVWGIVALRKGYREKKSLDSSKGDEVAMALEKKRITAQLLKIAGIILWPVGFGAALAVDAGFEVALGVGTTCSCVFLWWSKKVKSEYNASFKSGIVLTELSKHFENLDYTPDAHLRADIIRELAFFTHDDCITGNDFIAADYKGVHFMQSDICVEEHYVTTSTDDDGNSTEMDHYRGIFKGRAMCFDFAEAFRGEVQVVKKNFNGAKVTQRGTNWQSVETELERFNEDFRSFARDPLDAMAVLTPQMIEGIYYLEKAVKAPLALFFKGKSMYAFIALSRDAYDVTGKKTLLEEKELLEKDILLVKDFLDTMYFKRQERQDA